MATFLGTYKLCPNSTEIEVECYGTSYLAQTQTLEQEGFSAYAELETVVHGDTDITDYLSDNDLEKLTNLINEK